MTASEIKKEAGEKPATTKEVSMVEREVIKPISMKVDGVFKDIKVGTVVKFSPENAQIFSSKLAEVGFTKTKQGRKANIEKKLDEAEARVIVLEKELAASKQTSQALFEENKRLKVALSK